MGAFQAHAILILGPHACFRQPQTLVHGLQDSFGLITIGLHILANDFGDTGSQLVAAIVVGRTMSNGTTTVVECIAGPDAAVGIVQMVAIGIVVAFFPCQMRLEYRPHLTHISGIGIVLEVPQQLVDVVQVHIVMVHLIITLWISTDVTIAVHLRAPTLLGTRHV